MHFGTNNYFFIDAHQTKKTLICLVFYRMRMLRVPSLNCNDYYFSVNGEVGSDDSDEDDDANLSIVGSSGTQNGSGGRRRHHKIAMAYNA